MEEILPHVLRLLTSQEIDGMSSDDKTWISAVANRKFDCGFILVPSLQATEEDQKLWDHFLADVRKMFSSDSVVEFSDEEELVLFNVGDRPFLPFECHSFIRFNSKCQLEFARGADFYVRMVCKAAQRQFKGRVRFRNDISSNHSAILYQLCNKMMDIAVTTTFSAAIAAPDLSDAPPSPHYTLESIPGKGIGMVATRKIPKGCRILSECPLFVLTNGWRSPEDTSGYVALMLKYCTKEEQRAFFNLANSYPGTSGPIWGIAKTNALTLAAWKLNRVDSAMGVFRQASRINHACRPDCALNWNTKLRRGTIHALRDIEPGEELTINYTGADLPFGFRVTDIANRFGFFCECSFCTIPKHSRQRSDKRLQEMQQLDTEINNNKTSPVSNPRTQLRLLRRVKSICEVEGIVQHQPVSVYLDAIKTVIEHGDQARAHIFAERLYQITCTSWGEDDHLTTRAKRMMQKPRIHPRYRAVGRLWDRTTHEVPHNLVIGSKEFEDWLWTPQLSGHEQT